MISPPRGKSARKKKSWKTLQLYGVRGKIDDLKKSIDDIQKSMDLEFEDDSPDNATWYASIKLVKHFQMRIQMRNKHSPLSGD